MPRPPINDHEEKNSFLFSPSLSETSETEKVQKVMPDGLKKKISKSQLHCLPHRHEKKVCFISRGRTAALCNSLTMKTNKSKATFSIESKAAFDTVLFEFRGTNCLIQVSRFESRLRPINTSEQSSLCEEFSLTD